MRERQLDASRCAQGRELALAELVDAHRAVEVLEPVLSEVAQRLAVEERGRGGRDEDLVAVRERSDARSAVDVLADVALLGHGRSARVQAHAHADRSRFEPFVRRPRGFCGSLRCRERDEERVALRVDLDTAVRRGRLAHDLPVLGERVGVPRRPELVQQACRAFDVGEQQRHRPLRKIAHRTNDEGRAMREPCRTSAHAGWGRTPSCRLRDPPTGRGPPPSARDRRGN